MYGVGLTGYLTMSDAAKKLGVIRQAIYKLIKTGVITPAYAYEGTMYIIPESDLAHLAWERRDNRDGRIKAK